VSNPSTDARRKTLAAFEGHPWVERRRDWADDLASKAAKDYIDMLPTDEVSRVVDLGCMYGALIRTYLRPRFPEAHIVGVDLMPFALEYGRSQGGARYVEHNLEEGIPTLLDIDVFTATETVEHLYDPHPMLAGVSSALCSKQGKFVMTVPLGHRHDGGDHHTFHNAGGWIDLVSKYMRVLHWHLFNNDTQIAILAGRKDAPKPRTAFALYGFNRPHYLKQVVASIDVMESKEDVDFYYFQDGDVNINSGRSRCSRTIIEDNLGIIRGARTQFEIVESAHNLGGGMQQMSSAEKLIERDNYDVVVGTVEDHVVSRHFLRIRKVLTEQFLWEPQAFCVVNSWVNFMNEAKKRPTMDKYVRCMNTTSPGWTLFRNKWQPVKEKYMPYYDMLSKMDYHERNHQRIHKTFGIRATGHDGGFEWALGQTDMYCVLPVMNRIQDIGLMGLHKRPAINREHIERVTLHEFEEERGITRFVEAPEYYKDPEFNPGILRRPKE